jgi:hypothetical protein
MTSHWIVVRYTGKGAIYLTSNGLGDFYWSTTDVHMLPSKHAALELAEVRYGVVRQVFISSTGL